MPDPTPMGSKTPNHPGHLSPNAATPKPSSPPLDKQRLLIRMLPVRLCSYLGTAPPRLNRKNLGREFKNPKSCDGTHGIPKSPTRGRDSGRNPTPPIPAFSLSAIKAGGEGLGFLGTRHGGGSLRGFWDLWSSSWATVSP